MMEISYLWAMLAGEMLLILLMTTSALVLIGVTRRRRDRNAARELIGRILQGEEQRRRQTGELLESRYQYAGEALDQTVNDLINGEKLLYETFIKLYLERDAEGLKNLNVTFEAITNLYRTLRLPEVSSETAVAEVAGPDAELAERAQVLEQENERISKELRVTMETMGRMLNEYSTLYGGGASTALDKEKVKHLVDTPVGENPPENEETAAPATKAEAESVDVVVDLEIDTSDTVVDEMDEVSLEEQVQGVEVEFFDKNGEQVDDLLAELEILPDTEEQARTGETQKDEGVRKNTEPGAALVDDLEQLTEVAKTTTGSLELESAADTDQEERRGVPDLDQTQVVNPMDILDDMDDFVADIVGTATEAKAER